MRMALGSSGWLVILLRKVQLAPASRLIQSSTSLLLPIPWLGWLYTAAASSPLGSLDQPADAFVHGANEASARQQEDVAVGNLIDIEQLAPPRTQKREQCEWLS